MKRDFLKQLGIEDKETIDKILDENSSDIGRAKGDVDSLKAQIETLKSEKSTVESELDTLKNNTKDYDNLKEQVSTLQTEKANLETELNGKVSKLQKTHAIESGVRDAKAKNIKAVMALLDMDKITFENNELNGLSEQLESLTKGEDTSFLFGEGGSPTPSGTEPTNPPSGGTGSNGATGKSFADAIASALNSNN